MRFSAPLLRRSWLALFAVALGCSTSPRGTLTIELAPSIDDGCGPRAIPGEWECLRMQICESPPREGAVTPADAGTVDAGRRDAGGGSSDPCVQITVPGGNYDDATRELIVSRRELLAFDARVDPDRYYDIEVIAYTAGGGAAAVGRAPYVRPLDSDVRVRLQRFGLSSCPGPGDGAVVAHRAFGAAVALPNGDVLHLGGATGTNVPAAELIASARFQPVIQVYDVSRGRYRNVTLPDGAPFLRVLFEARHIETLGDGRERIRIFGGFGAGMESTVSVRLDDKLGFSDYGNPILPGGGTTAEQTMDLLLDPTSLAATLELVPGPGITSVGGAAVSEVIDGTVVSVGGTPATDPAVPVTSAQLANAFQVWSTSSLETNTSLDGTSAGGRIGATVTYLGDDTFLAWGGGILPTPSTPTGVEHLEAAGILIDLGSATPSSSLVPAPATPVAYHTATRLGPDRVLIAGGATITATASAATPAIALSPAPAGFTILSRSGTTVTATAVGGTSREATLFHTATVLSESGGVPTAIVVIGGAVTRGAAILTTFRAMEGQNVGVLRGSGSSWTYTEMAALENPRFGHSATLIPGVGVLVSGGYQRGLTGDGNLEPVGQDELFLLDDLLGLEAPPPVICGGGEQPDAPRRMDAGVEEPDAPEGEEDAPPAALDAP